jgi:hypothetical protein
MANLSKQRDTIIRLIDDSLKQQATLEKLTTPNAAGQVSELHIRWIRERLESARQILSEIDVEKVFELRAANKDTIENLESPIDDARSKYYENYGIKPLISAEFENSKKHSSATIKTLRTLDEIANRTLRRLTIMRSRWLSRATSGWLWCTLLIIALLSIPVYRYTPIYLESLRNGHAAATATTVAKFDKDREQIISSQSTPGKSLLEKSASTVKDIWTLMDTIPKIFNALCGIWAGLLLWMRR